MRKIFFMISFATVVLGLNSCDCRCYKNPNTSVVVCKEDVEALNGPGSWPEFASELRAQGWSCQN